MKSNRLITIVSVTLVVAIASPTTAAERTLTGKSNGIIRQGPYLLCGDDEGRLHLLYQGRLLVGDMGISCSLKGCATSRDMQRLGDVIRTNNGVTYRGRVSGRDITFEQSASIVGDRIRIRIGMTGHWPEDEWASFQVKLPVALFGNAHYLADGNRRPYPKLYALDHQMADDFNRIECQLEQLTLNLMFKSDSGLWLQDSRKYGVHEYELGMSAPAKSGEHVDLFLSLPKLDAVSSHRAVRYSPIGYAIRGEKAAALEWDDTDARPDDRVYLEDRRGRIIKRGTFGRTRTFEFTQGAFAEFDFSEVNQPGQYRVVWSGGATGWFPIRESVFTDRLWQPTLDASLPFMMCHAEVRLPASAPGHDRCHMDDGARAPAHYQGPDGFVSHDATGTPYAAGEHIQCDKGGWHDAGDYDVNVHANGYATWVLALAYEEFGIDRDVATLDADTQSFAADTPDSISDILQQVEWGSLWLLSMQQADSRAYLGVCANQEQRAGELGRIHDGRPGTGDERQVYVDYHADGQLVHAIALAAAGRVLRKSNGQLAERCTEAARRSFDYFQTHHRVVQAGGYAASEIHGDEDDAMAISAAIELYLTTRDKKYLAVVKTLSSCLPKLEFEWPLPYTSGSLSFWYSPPFLARLHPHLPECELKATIEQACRRAAKLQTREIGKRPWPVDKWDFHGWGNTRLFLVRVFDTYWLHRIAPDILSPKLLPRSMYWVYGLRPTCDTCFVCGLGLPEPQHLYSAHLTELFGDKPAGIPGAVVPGIGSYQGTGVIAYADRHGNYNHNEACVYTQAVYIFAVRAMQEMGF